MMRFIKQLLGRKKNAPEAQGARGAEISIPVELIKPNPFQVRKYFDQEKIQSLAESIKAQGLLQPIVVHKVAHTEGMYYELIAGERRFLAAKMAGMLSIPAVIRDIQGNLRALALLENIQREDLTVPELVNAVADLKKEYGSIEAVAQAMGHSRRYVERYSRIHTALNSIPGLAPIFEKQIKIEYGPAFELAKIIEELQPALKTDPDKCRSFCEEVEKGIEMVIANYGKSTEIKIHKKSAPPSEDGKTPQVQKNPSPPGDKAPVERINSSSANEAISCSIKEDKRGLTLLIQCPHADQVPNDSKTEIRKTIREFMAKLNMLDFDI